jgi:MFS family permease
MVIYMPIYLYQYIHFNWSEIGVMFTIMLLPFVLFELPVGELADHKYGEKELMAIGFVIMGVSTLLVSLITVKSIILWTILLFFTRTGASFVEITSDSYFFKQVDDRQTNVISTYRTTRPLGFIMAPIFVTISLQYVPYQYIFFILGCIILTGIYWSSRIVDTK